MNLCSSSGKACPLFLTVKSMLMAKPLVKVYTRCGTMLLVLHDLKTRDIGHASRKYI